MKITYGIILMSLISLSCKQISDQDIAVVQPDKNYEVEQVIEGLTIPWGMVWLPDGACSSRRNREHYIILKMMRKSRFRIFLKFMITDKVGCSILRFIPTMLPISGFI